MEAASNDTKIKCTLCGAVFEPKAEAMCSGCPFRKACKLICCPNCGFQIPADSKLTEWVKHKLDRQRSS